jgi:hypothetical protein
MTKFYSTKSTAKRALKTALAKIDLELEDVPFEIKEEEGSGFYNFITFEGELPDGVEILEEVSQWVRKVEEQQKPSTYIREKSNHGGVCAEVWAVADSMKGAARKDVIEACRALGIAYGTARTQYQKWKEASAKK